MKEKKTKKKPEVKKNQGWGSTSRGVSNYPGENGCEIDVVLVGT